MSPTTHALRRNWIESHQCSELTGPERKRICGSDSFDAWMSWCEDHGVPYTMRTVIPGFQPKQVPVTYGRDVAAHFGNYWWADDFKAEFVGARPPSAPMVAQSVQQAQACAAPTSRAAALAPLWNWLPDEPVTDDDVRAAVHEADDGDTIATLSDDGRVLTISRWMPGQPANADPDSEQTIELDAYASDDAGRQAMLDALDPEFRS